MISQQENEACELALALSWGYASLSEVIEWADTQIVSDRQPSIQLIDLSLSHNVPDALSQLNAIADSADFWVAATNFLNRFCSLDVLPPFSALILAEHLYHLAIRVDSPPHFTRFVSHWDSIDLALAGYSGRPEVQVATFLADIKSVAESVNTGPKA